MIKKAGTQVTRRLPQRIHAPALPVLPAALVIPNEPFWRHQFGLTSAAKFRPNSVFVIMSFKGKAMQRVYTAIVAECGKIGLEASRVDESPGSGLIIKNIVESIEAAEFIVCDLSRERPNVYYELGYAHGLGNHGSNILLIARRGTPLHFDLAPLQVKYYHSPETLHATIESGLKKMMEVTRSRGLLPSALAPAPQPIAVSADALTNPPSAPNIMRPNLRASANAEQTSRIMKKRTQQKPK